MITMDVERLPQTGKSMKKIASKNQTPEELEQGIVRAKYEVPVFRDGTVRFEAGMDFDLYLSVPSLFPFCA